MYKTETRLLNTNCIFSNERFIVNKCCVLLHFLYVCMIKLKAKIFIEILRFI